MTRVYAPFGLAFTFVDMRDVKNVERSKLLRKPLNVQTGTLTPLVYGQIYEARHQPGAFALPSRVVWDLLDATCEEIARNGFKKILIVNGHGGNPQLLRFFVQSQLERRRDYVVYFYDPKPDPAFTEKVNKLRKSDPAGDARQLGHAARGYGGCGGRHGRRLASLGGGGDFFLLRAPAGGAGLTVLGPSEVAHSRTSPEATTHALDQAHWKLKPPRRPSTSRISPVK
jgi:hypothetical protein